MRNAHAASRSGWDMGSGSRSGSRLIQSVDHYRDGRMLPQRTQRTVIRFSVTFKTPVQNPLKTYEYVMFNLWWSHCIYYFIVNTISLLIENTQLAKKNSFSELVSVLIEKDASLLCCCGFISSVITSYLHVRHSRGKSKWIIFSSRVILHLNYILALL